MGPSTATAATAGAADSLMRRRSPRLRRRQLLLHHVEDPAVSAHLEPLERPRRREHRVTRELAQHVADHLLGPKRLAAAHAIEDRRLVENPRLACFRTEREPRL